MPRRKLMSMPTADGLRVIVLGLVTAGLVVISRSALLQVRSHGFARFFAWEAIVMLVLLNAPFWFVEPLSAGQAGSWSLLCLSLFVLWRGVQTLRSGHPSERRSEPELYRFERTSTLVTTDIYGYIRHPLYASLWYLAGGALLKDVSWASAALFVVATFSLVATAIADERECITYFGREYEAYMKTTKRFIPRVW